MDDKTLREQVKKVVREQDELQTQLAKLRDRSATLDAQLDQLLKPGGPTQAKAAPAKSGTSASVPAAATASVKPKVQKAKKKVKAKAASAPTQAAPVAAAPKAAAPKAAAPKAATKAKTATKAASSPSQPAAAAPGGASIRDRILSTLRENPGGLDLAVLAKQIYGTDDKDACKRCEQNLYNIGKQKLVRHDGPKWQLASK